MSLRSEVPLRSFLLNCCPTTNILHYVSAFQFFCTGVHLTLQKIFKNKHSVYAAPRAPLNSKAETQGSLEGNSPKLSQMSGFHMNCYKLSFKNIDLFDSFLSQDHIDFNPYILMLYMQKINILFIVPVFK